MMDLISLAAASESVMGMVTPRKNEFGFLFYYRGSGGT
jgi:hypothetical protein